MHYHFRVYKEENGYWANCIELQGCQSQGDTIEDLKNNLAESSNSEVIFIKPDESLEGKDFISIKVDPKIAFANCLRMERIKHKMTQKEAAAKLGYKSIWAYQKLESSSKTNPELKTISKIKELFPDLDLNYVLT